MPTYFDECAVNFNINLIPTQLSNHQTLLSGGNNSVALMVTYDVQYKLYEILFIILSCVTYKMKWLNMVFPHRRIYNLNKKIYNRSYNKNTQHILWCDVVWYDTGWLFVLRLYHPARLPSCFIPSSTNHEVNFVYMVVY